MPPSPSWYFGRASVADLLRRWILPAGPFRTRASGANLQPAAVLSVVGADGNEQPVGVRVSRDRGKRSRSRAQTSQGPTTFAARPGRPA